MEVGRGDGGSYSRRGGCHLSSNHFSPGERLEDFSKNMAHEGAEQLGIERHRRFGRMRLRQELPPTDAFEPMPDGQLLPTGPKPALAVHPA